MIRVYVLTQKKLKVKLIAVFMDVRVACRDFDVRFHLFPKINTNFVKITNAFGQSEKVDCRKMWQIVLKIGKNITDHMQVCSLHFKKSDYFSPGDYICLLFSLRNFFIYKVKLNHHFVI